MLMLKCWSCWAHFCDCQLIVFIFVSTAFKRYHRIPIFHYPRYGGYSCHSQGGTPLHKQASYLEASLPLTSCREGSDPKKFWLGVQKYRTPAWIAHAKLTNTWVNPPNRVSDVLLPPSVTFIQCFQNQSKSILRVARFVSVDSRNEIVCIIWNRV